MQREKLYNLHKTTYFIVALLCFQNGQNFVRSNFDRAKMGLFLIQDELVFFYFILLLSDMFY
jgi:hypothetical protein